MTRRALTIAIVMLAACTGRNAKPAGPLTAGLFALPARVGRAGSRCGAFTRAARRARSRRAATRGEPRAEPACSLARSRVRALRLHARGRRHELALRVAALGAAAAPRKLRGPGHALPRAGRALGLEDGCGHGSRALLRASVRAGRLAQPRAVARRRRASRRVVPRALPIPGGTLASTAARSARARSAP